MTAHVTYICYVVTTQGMLGICPNLLQITLLYTDKDSPWRLEFNVVITFIYTKQHSCFSCGIEL